MSRAPLARPSLDALLRDLGSRIRRGDLPTEEAPRLPTGLEALDALLGGGFPRGRLCEVAGPPSSGRTSLALALLARTTREGANAAWVDGANAFDPPSAAAAGTALERVLWVRAARPNEALRGAERLLESRGFPLVVLDLVRGAPPRPALPDVAWTRLARAAAGAEAALVLIADARLAGAAAGLALELGPGTAHFTGTPLWLEGFEAEVRLTRARVGAADGRSARIRLSAAPDSAA